MSRQATWVGSMWVLGGLARWIGEPVAMATGAVLFVALIFWPSRGGDE